MYCTSYRRTKSNRPDDSLSWYEVTSTHTNNVPYLSSHGKLFDCASGPACQRSRLSIVASRCRSRSHVMPSWMGPARGVRVRASSAPEEEVNRLESRPQLPTGPVSPSPSPSSLLRHHRARIEPKEAWSFVEPPSDTFEPRFCLRAARAVFPVAFQLPRGRRRRDTGTSRYLWLPG